MRITEMFHSVQGEGEFLGTPSVFVRTSGCNLRCWFCDTPYSSWEPEGTQRTWRDVLQDVLAYETEHVVITGGEPLLQRDVVPLSRALAEHGKFVTFETAGTVHRPVDANLMSISPKLSNSTPRADVPTSGQSAHDRARWTARHERVRQSQLVVSQLMGEFPYQLKFVVDEPGDFSEIAVYLEGLEDVRLDRVWIMPQAITAEDLAAKTAWIAPAAAERGYRFTSRLHIELFGNTRGT